VLGHLFGATTREKVKQEIVVFLTPHVIESPGDLNRRSQATLDNYAYVPTEVMQNELDRWLRDLRDDTHAFHYNRGTVLLESGRIEDAIAALRRAAELSSSDASTRLNLGLALARAGKLLDGERALEEAERLDPRDAEIPYDLGAVLWRRGDFPRAARAFERAVALDVDHPEAARWLIRARRELARLEAELLERNRAATPPPPPTEQESNR
jgi:tetratricopeptide (TPR) repeat protein